MLKKGRKDEGGTFESSKDNLPCNLYLDTRRFVHFGVKAMRSSDPTAKAGM